MVMLWTCRYHSPVPGSCFCRSLKGLLIQMGPTVHQCLTRRVRNQVHEDHSGENAARGLRRAASRACVYPPDIFIEDHGHAKLLEARHDVCRGVAQRPLVGARVNLGAEGVLVRLGERGVRIHRCLGREAREGGERPSNRHDATMQAFNHLIPISFLRGTIMRGLSACGGLTM